MLPPNLDSLTSGQRLVVEQAFVLATELESAADSAPEGQLIDRCESFLLGNGRDFLRRVLGSTLQSRAESLEKKTVPPEGVRVGWGDGTTQGKRVQGDHGKIIRPLNRRPKTLEASRRGRGRPILKGE